MANLSEFIEQLHADAATGGPSFKAHAHYDRDGDCIEFLISDEDFFAERVDSLVTVYYGRESGEIVGSLIKGVKAHIQDLLRKLPGFKVEIQDGKIRLKHLFAAQLWSFKEDSAVGLTYRKLRAAAESADAEAELCAT